jgi:hypothetical protein
VAPDADVENETALDPAPEPAPAPESVLTFVPRTPAASMPDTEDGALAGRVEQLERTIAEMQAMLLSLRERIDGAATAPAGHAPQRADDEEWEDEAPQMQRVAYGAPPRPAVFRDIAPAAPPPPPAASPPAAPRRADTAPVPERIAARAEERRGLDLLPRTYRITVEDKRRGVDLVPLHRALLAMDGVRDMSLLSYNNGVAIVSLETVSDIDPQVLARAVSRAMSREATVETHNERTLVVKLAEA